MKKQNKYTNNEDGFVLISALLILLVLTVLGIAVNRNTTIEWQIAMNDRYHKEAFYDADAATELASEVLEQSIACLGFAENANGMRLPGSTGYDIYIDKDSLGFWRNYSKSVSFPSDSDRDLVYPAVIKNGGLDTAATNEQPHANINIGGNTQLTAGAAISIAQGYGGGAGKSMALNGATLVYDINVQQIGQQGSISDISIQYGHVLGSEGSCNY